MTPRKCFVSAILRLVPPTSLAALALALLVALPATPGRANDLKFHDRSGIYIEGAYVTNTPLPERDLHVELGKISFPVDPCRDSRERLAYSATFRSATDPPRIRPGSISGDEGYSYRRIRDWLRSHGIRAVIAQPSDQIEHHRGGPIEIDKNAYRRRAPA